ncbi:PCMD domain-containing protein [Prevotellamassilia timonensis]|uniref:PCMD domain-containing protein n=1 Tax=Prevotellamassilia timonensis TaxID=1852370 RepID=UPI0040268C97
MKRIILFMQAALLLCTLNSCIQDEPLNAECDITGVDTLWLQQNRSLIKGNPRIGNYRVTFTVPYDADRSALAPRFYLTPGARLTAMVDGVEVADANGMTRDFNTPQTYTAHSQDGQWSKSYEVSFESEAPIEKLDFENFELDPSGRYQVWFEMDANDASNPRRNYWASGNPGYNLTGLGSSPGVFPTTAAEGGVSGKCIKLETKDTGMYGMNTKPKMPIAAGNLFIGEFELSKASRYPRKATKFGLPLVRKKPVTLEGYYKYKAGAKFTDAKKKVQPTMHDTADIYAVVYEIDPDNFVPLDGDNILTASNIALMARIDKPAEFEGDMSELAAADWVHFSEPFKPVNGKEFDAERLARGGYAIAIVMTSSRQGAYFEGAIGSTLYVDQLRVVYE